MSVIHKVVLGTLPFVPRPLMRRLAARYIAGEELSDAIARLKSLAGRGFPGIIDVLGEGIANEAEARAVVAHYEEAASAIAREKLDCYVSVKPTHVGLSIREDLCFELYARLAEHTAKLGLFLRVEMEDAPTTDGTLRVFERLRGHHSNVGIVLQARLFRTLADIDALQPGPLDVRMVKGIYLEPAAIAHTEPKPISDAYIACVEKLCARGARLSLATHDEHLAARCIAVLKRHGRATSTYEFQVLLGVREELWAAWKTQGHRVRVYVPFGPDWRAYSQRRMRKNPQILRAVMRNMVGLK
ncbi:MAG: proline dehydrogenase family protein [Planctomycetota bacterium]|nr:proline dehydrogenase family protein [Planctomycetota bacterium]